MRGDARVKTVVVTTTVGFAGLWLIPRLTGFTATRPDVDVRISATNTLANLNRDGVDVAIRYQVEPPADTPAPQLFGEVELPVCSPRLLRDRGAPAEGAAPTCATTACCTWTWARAHSRSNGRPGCA